jgi:hypothetical protein
MGMGTSTRAAAGGRRTDKRPFAFGVTTSFRAYYALGRMPRFAVGDDGAVGLGPHPLEVDGRAESWAFDVVVNMV